MRVVVAKAANSFPVNPATWVVVKEPATEVDRPSTVVDVKPANWLETSPLTWLVVRVERTVVDRALTKVVAIPPNCVAPSAEICVEERAASTVVDNPLRVVAFNPAIWVVVRPAVSSVLRTPKVVVATALRAVVASSATIAEVSKTAASRAVMSVAESPRIWVPVNWESGSTSRLVVAMPPNWLPSSEASCVVVKSVMTVVDRPLSAVVLRPLICVVLIQAVLVVDKFARVVAFNELRVPVVRLATMVVTSRPATCKASTPLPLSPRNWVVVAEARGSATKLVVDIPPSWFGVRAANWVVVKAAATVDVRPLKAVVVKPVIVRAAKTLRSLVLRSARVVLLELFMAVGVRLATMVVVSWCAASMAETSSPVKPPS